jgi:hypothetical protein
VEAGAKRRFSNRPLRDLTRHETSIRCLTQTGRAFHEKTATVRVVRVLRGTCTGEVLRVRTRTGLVFFDRHLEAGDAGVLFLKASPRGDFESAYPGGFALFEKGKFTPVL